MIAKTFKLFMGDKKILLYALIPILIGMALYFFLGSWMLGDFYVIAKDFVAAKLNMDSEGWLSYAIMAGLSVALFFIINWGFVLIVSIIAAPFNDLIVQRVKRDIIDRDLKPEGFFSRFFSIIANEFKKIGFIIFLGLIAFIFGFIFPPIGMVIAFWLLSISFVDYSWSLEELTFKECLSNFKSNFISYTIYGAVFSFFISIPVINIIILPFGVTHYALTFYSKRKKSE